MRELRTYTSLWGMEKRLYKFYDINLPYPVSIKQIGFFLGTLVPWFILLSLVNFPFSNPWYVVWIAPPFFAAYIGNKPVAEGKKLTEYVFSQTSFFLSGKTYTNLSPDSQSPTSGEEEKVKVVCEVQPPMGVVNINE